MIMTLRLLTLFGAMMFMLPADAFAQAWPTKQPIRVIIPFSAGSATDIVPRTVLEQVGKQLGQTFVVENRPGGGGTIGMAAVAKADPDGYTLLAHSATYAVSAVTHTNPGYDARRDFAGISGFANVPNVLVVPANKYASLKDLVAAGKAKPDSLNYASAGTGGASHLNAERLLMAAGIKAQHVPFKGGPEALNEVMSGRVDFYFIPLPPARGLIASGKVTALAVSGSQRASALPDIPTTLEAGFPNSDYNFWIGLFAPAKTPPEIVNRLNQETIKAMQDPGVREKLSKLGADPMPMTPAEFDSFVKQEIELNATLVKAAGVTVQ
jgi:tripartite-type tricarboxylate transporter receptor subunit TctC